MKVVVDAMGGDRFPHVPVMGAVEAAKEFGINVVLVGNEKLIKQELSHYSFPEDLVDVENADGIIGMDDQPSEALKKVNSSIHVGMDLVKKGLADGFVSAGNTGAVMAIALFKLGRLIGINRPAISVILPNLKDNTLLLDIGANVDLKPINLLQFAIMGETYARYVLKKQRPRIGILSIGEEKGKGNKLVKESYHLLLKAKTKGLNFIGNAEGRDIYSGKFDVIVCDGFVGNIVLKLSESLAKILAKVLKEEIQKHFVSRIGALSLIPAIKGFRKRIDYAEWGGAPLLGIKAPVIISHGSSNPKAIKNAVLACSDFVNKHLNDHIEENIKRYDNGN